MAFLRFDILHPDGRGETIVVEADRVLVGNGAHCEVRLALDQAAVEHVLIEVSGNVVRAQARAFDPPTTIQGVSFTEAPLAPDSVLVVGRTQMRIALTDAPDPGGNVVHAKKNKTSPLTYLLVAIAMPLAGYVILTDEEPDAVAAGPPKAPELWEAAAPPPCPQSGAQAAALGREKVRVADGKRERRPFHVQDGVAAVPLFEAASACFRAGGDAAAADDAQGAATQLRTQVGDDYRTHRVRLEHALSVKDYKTAQREARVLLAFCEGKSGDYVTWLSNLDRKLRLQYGRE